MKERWVQARRIILARLETREETAQSRAYKRERTGKKTVWNPCLRKKGKGEL